MVTEAMPVDLLISGADVVTFDDAGTEVLNGAIAVKGNQIHWIGPAAEAATQYLETPASAQRRAKLREQQRLARISRPRPDARPDKRERRRLMRLHREQS